MKLTDPEKQILSNVLSRIKPLPRAWRGACPAGTGVRKSRTFSIPVPIGDKLDELFMKDPMVTRSDHVQVSLQLYFAVIGEEE